MKIIAILGGLFLMAYAQEKCREEIKSTEYYIYNTNVTIWGFLPVSVDYNCDQYNWTKIMMNFTEIKQRYGFYVNGMQCDYSSQECTYCIFLLQANLLENRITLPSNITAPYEPGWFKKQNSTYYWNRDPCYVVELLYNGKFNTWTDLQNQYKYIQNQPYTLDLVKETTLCNVSIWKTNYNGIVVATNNITTARKKVTKNKFNSMSLYDNCNVPRPITATAALKTVLPTKKWFIYKYPTEVTVHFCSPSGNQNNSTLLKQCMDQFSNSSIDSSIAIQNQILFVDLRTDTIMTLPRECKYSDGICPASKAFWSYSSKCGNVVQIFEGYEDICNNTRCVINNSRRWILQEPGQLCGVNITYTHLPGVVASELEIDFSPPLSDNDVDTILMRYDDKISHLEYWLLLFVILCVLCYFFNVIVNFISLRKLNKRKGIRNKTTLLNCVSQGLTTRYILRKSAPASSQFEIVENDIYNKPKYTRDH